MLLIIHNNINDSESKYEVNSAIDLDNLLNQFMMRIDYPKENFVAGLQELAEELSRNHTDARIENTLMPSVKQLKKSIDLLNKGLNGDWTKEGYEITHKEHPKYPTHVHVLAHKDGQLVGELHVEKNGKEGKAILVHVDKNHRRKGIAAGMYQHAEKVGDIKMKRSKDQTDAGKALWRGTRKYPKPFGKSEQLEKGLNGDWQKEGYTLSYHPHPYDETYFEIHAHDPNGKKIGHAEFVHSPKGAGIEHYDDGLPFNDSMSIVHVDKAHRRKGIASGMYQEAERITGKRLRNIRANKRTPDGKAFWSQPNRPFSKLKKGLNGDWQKEGYKLSHEEYFHDGSDRDIHPGPFNPKQHGFIVVAKDPNGKEVGHVTIAHANGGPNKDTHILSIGSEIDSEHRRKGLASAMYKYAENLSTKPMTVGSTSDDAKALWSNPKRNFGDLKKALILPPEAGDSVAEGLIYRQPSRSVRIKTEEVGTHPVTKQPLYHHVFKQQPYPGETKYHHVLSTDKDGRDGIGAMEVSHVSTSDSPAVERSGVKKEHRRMGLGKLLYQKALEHHGKLKSDYSLSPRADSIWKKLADAAGVSVQRGKEGTMEPHVAEMKKSEDEHGMTKYDLGDGYSLHHTDWTEDGMATTGPWGNKRHYWEIRQNGNKKAIGRILLDRAPYVHDEHHKGMHVSHSWIHPKFRGIGLGQKSYQILASHYGELASDPRKTSTSAKRVWNKLKSIKAGKTLGQKDRFLIQGNDDKSKVMWNKDLQKSEELKKDVGRIKFNLPNDKHEFNKIPDRPDQEVKNVQTPKQVEIGLRQAAYPDRKAFSNNTTNAAIKMAYTTLNPEKGQVKGVNVPSTLGTGKAMSLGEHHPVTAEHEGFHYLMHQIRNRHGHEAGNRFINSALAMVHPEDLHSITGMLSGGVYKDDEYLPEEKLAHIRDVLTDKNTRDVFHAHHMEKYINGESPVGIQEATNRLKTSWKAIRNMAKEVRPEHLENEDKMRMLANKHMPVYR